MRNRFDFIGPILDYMGALFWIFGFVLAAPLAARLYCARPAAEAGERMDRVDTARTWVYFRILCVV